MPTGDLCVIPTCAAVDDAREDFEEMFGSVVLLCHEEPSALPPLVAGGRVMLFDLNNSGLMGKDGLLDHFDETAGRWLVFLYDGRRVRCKVSNLRAIF